MELQYGNEIGAEDYNKLREAVGWGAVEAEQAEIGLRNSALVVSCKEKGQTIACSRVIWDGGYVVYIADVIVLPDYQGKGIGREMMTRVMDYIRSQAKTTPASSRSSPFPIQSAWVT